MSNSNEIESEQSFRKKRKRQIKRDSIIRYAEQAFIGKGYSNTTLDEIALNSGNTKTTIYNYFNSKEDLLAAVMKNIYEKFSNIIVENLQKTIKDKGLRALSDAYLMFDSKFPLHSQLLNSPELLLVAKNIFDKFKQNLTLTESEIEYKEAEDKLAILFGEILTNFLNNSNISQKLPEETGLVLYYFSFTIREVVRRGQLSGDLDEENKILEMVFNIIESGFKSYFKVK